MWLDPFFFLFYPMKFRRISTKDGSSVLLALCCSQHRILHHVISKEFLYILYRSKLLFKESVEPLKSYWFLCSSSHRLRALSSGGSVTSPPPSPAMPKYKLAEYRYGREEMLALYIKDNKVGEEEPFTFWLYVSSLSWFWQCWWKF